MDERGCKDSHGERYLYGEKRWRREPSECEGKESEQHDHRERSKEHPGGLLDGSRHRRCAARGKDDDRGEQNEVQQQRRNTPYDRKAGAEQKDELRKEQRQVEENQQEGEFCGKQLLPLIRARGPELVEADEALCVDERDDEDDPGHAEEKEQA